MGQRAVFVFSAWGGFPPPPPTFLSVARVSWSTRFYSNGIFWWFYLPHQCRQSNCWEHCDWHLSRSRQQVLRCESQPKTFCVETGNSVMSNLVSSSKPFCYCTFCIWSQGNAVYERLTSCVSEISLSCVGKYFERNMPACNLGQAVNCGHSSCLSHSVSVWLRVCCLSPASPYISLANLLDVAALTSQRAVV